MFSFEPQPCHFLPQDSQNTQTIQSTFGNSRLAALLDPGSDRRLLFRLPWYWIGILPLLTKRTNLSNGSNNMLRSGYECDNGILFSFLHRGTKNWNSMYLPMKTSYHNYLFPDMLSASDNGTELLVLRNTVSSNKYMQSRVLPRYCQYSMFLFRENHKHWNTEPCT